MASSSLPDSAVHARRALTWLFVPGDRPDRFAKAAGSGADAILLDLEDAVEPAQKDVARDSVLSYLRAGNPGYVRVNAAGDGQLHEADLQALASAGPALRGVMLPKAQADSPFAQIDRELPAGAVIVALIESPAGVRDAYEVARAPRVARMAFGPADFRLETGIEDAERGMLLARSTLVLASAAAGLASPIDGISTALDDGDAVRADAEDGRRLGFTGKLCLHPKQIVPTLLGLAPREQEREWARRVADAAAESGGRAIRVGGQMVDRPLLERAERVLERAGQIEAAIAQAGGE